MHLFVVFSTKKAICHVCQQILGCAKINHVSLPLLVVKRTIPIQRHVLWRYLPTRQPRSQTAVLLGRRFFFCATTHLRPPMVARGINMLHYRIFTRPAALPPTSTEPSLSLSFFFLATERGGEGGLLSDACSIIRRSDTIRYHNNYVVSLSVKNRDEQHNTKQTTQTQHAVSVHVRVGVAILFFTAVHVMPVYTLCSKGMHQGVTQQRERE